MKILAHLAIIIAALVFTGCSEVEYININGDNGAISDTDVELSGAVDLGLSVKWAACDLGAKLPYVSGNEYTAFSLYESGGSDICGTENDPATALLGQGWHMPSRQEVEELINDCTWKAAVFHKVEGWLVTGPSGKTIFFKSYTRYLTCTLDESIAYCLNCEYSYVSMVADQQNNIMRPIRPVQD